MTMEKISNLTIREDSIQNNSKKKRVTISTKLTVIYVKSFKKYNKINCDKGKNNELNYQIKCDCVII